MAIVGSAHVDVHLDMSAVKGELERGLKAALAGVNPTIKVGLDTAAFDAVMAHVKDELDDIDGRVVGARVDIDSAAAVAQLQNIEAASGRIDGRTLNIDVDVDTGSAVAQIAAVGSAADGAGNSMDGFSTRTKLIATAITTLTGPALGALGGAFAALPGLIAIGGAAIGAVALGIDGIKASAESVKPALDGLRESVSATFERGLTPVMNRIADEVLPSMENGINGVARSLVGLAREFVNTIAAGNNLDGINEILANTRQFFEALEPAVRNFTNTFITMAAVGSQGMIGLAGQITRATDEFGKFIERASDTGLLTQAFEGLNATMGGVFDVINQLIFSGIELSATLGGPLGTTLTALARLFAALTPILEVVGGLFLDLLTTIANALAPAFVALEAPLRATAAALGTALGEAIRIVVPALVALATAFLDIVTALAPLLQPLAELAAMIGLALADAVRGAMPLIEALANGLGVVLRAAIDAIRPILPVLVQALIDIFNAFVPLIPIVADLAVTIINILAPAIPPLIRVFADLMVALTPLIAALLEMASAILSALAPVIPILVDAFVRLVEAVIPLIQPITELVVALIPPLTRLIEALIPVLEPLVLAFVDLFEALIPILPPLLQIAAEILPLLIEALVRIMPAVEAVISVMVWWWGVVADGARVLGELLQRIADFISGAQERWAAFKEWIGAIFLEITNIFTSSWASMFSSGEETQSDMDANSRTRWDAYKTWWDLIWTSISSAFGPIWQGIFNIGEEHQTNMDNSSRTRWGSWGEWWDLSWGTFRGVFTGHWDGIVLDGDERNKTLDTQTRGTTSGLTSWLDITWGVARGTLFGHWSGIVGDTDERNKTLDTQTRGTTTGLTSWLDTTWNVARGVFFGHWSGIVSDTDERNKTLDTQTRGTTTGLTTWMDTTWRIARGVFFGHWSGIVADGDGKNRELDRNTRSVMGLLGTWWDSFWNSTMVTAVRNGMNAITGEWNRLREAAAAPVRFVVNTVYNGGLKALWDAIARVLGATLAPAAPALPFADGGQVPGFANGGEIRGRWRGPKADNLLGLVDNRVPIKVNPKEWIQPVASVNKYGSQFMRDVQTGRFPVELARGRQAYDGREPARFCNGGQPGGCSHDHQHDYHFGGQIPGFATGDQIFAVTRAAFPRAKLNSAYRPGDPGYHGKNQAADMGEAGFAGGAGRQYIADMDAWWVQNYGSSAAEIIYDGLFNRARDVWMGAPHTYSAATQQQHYNHLHVAYPQALSGATGAPGGVIGSGTAAVTVMWEDLFAAFKGQIASLFSTPARAIVNAIPYDEPPLWEAFPKKYGNRVIDDAVTWFTGKAEAKAKADAAAANAAAGVGVAPATAGPIKDQVSQVFAQRGWGMGSQYWPAVDWLVQKESSWNPNAQNPVSTASGLFQHIDATWAAYKPAGATAAKMRLAPVNQQAQAGLNYIAARRQNPIAAQAFHQANGWYSGGGQVLMPRLMDDGGWLRPGRTLVENRTGRNEAVISNPMTAFRHSFRDVFEWFTPRVENTLNDCFDRWGRHEDRRWDRHGRDEERRWNNWWRKPGYQIGKPNNDPAIPVIPAPPVPPLPPVILPPSPVQVPTGDIGAALTDSFTRLAPELSLALQAGSREQIASLGTELLGNSARIDAIMADMAAQLGHPVDDIRASIQQMVASAGPVGGPQGLSDLQRQFLGFKDFLAANLNTPSGAHRRLDKLGALGDAFKDQFPQIHSALHTWRIDANKVMAQQTDAIYAWLQRMDADEAGRVLEALSGVPAQTAVAMTQAQQTVAASSMSNSAAPTVTVESGAVQVTIAGNADAVTVAQLQQVLTDFQDQLVQEVVGSR